MRVAQICPYAWSAYGGVQTHVRHLSRHLAARGHDVLVLAPDDADGRRDAGPAAHHDGPVPRLRVVGPCVRVPFNGSVVPICVRPRAFSRLRLALDEFRPDVVHVHEPLAPLLSLAASWRVRAPLVGTFHSHYPPSFDAVLRDAAMRGVRPALRRLSVRVAVSQAAADGVAALVGAPVRIVPNGVDLATFGAAAPLPLPPGRRLLAVNRLERRKGFSVLLSAFERLIRAADDLWLVVVGTGPCQDAADALPAAVRRRVIMLGAVADADLPGVYAAADAFLAPALGGESFGLVLLEAMAAGVPVVASDIPGYREVARAGREALLAAPGEPGALANATLTLLGDAALASRLRRAGRERAREFAWEGLCPHVERAYHDAATGLRPLGAAEVVAIGSAP